MTETIVLISPLYHLGKSSGYNSDYITMLKLSIAYIIHRSTRNGEQPFCSIKHADMRRRRALICYDNLASLGSSFKSGVRLYQIRVRSYLKASGYLRFKAYRKPSLISKHKEDRLCLVREHEVWTLEDWRKDIWTD